MSEASITTVHLPKPVWCVPCEAAGELQFFYVQAWTKKEAKNIVLGELPGAKIKKSDIACLRD